MKKIISSYLSNPSDLIETDNYLEQQNIHYTEGLKANRYYFNHAEWAEEYLTYCHREETFKQRWEKALGDVTGKIVVDIGCGPGNIFSTLTQKPKLLIGIDVAPYSLELAKKAGYLPVLADAHQLPFISAFADVVILNAALHHCEDMEKVLKEAARLVKPGGLLVTDHDPQITAWDYKGPAKLLWNSREILYKILGKGFHKTNEQQHWGLRCELHHKPGHGVSKEFFDNALADMGFNVNVYPHNHTKGAEVFKGEMGKADFKYVLGNVLSGRNPKSSKSALTLMCVAEKN